MKIELDGENILCEMDFHRKLSKMLDVQDFYGANLSALWDLLSANVERPLILIWRNSEISRENMGESFDKIKMILDRVVRRDEQVGWADKFSYVLC